MRVDIQSSSVPGLEQWCSLAGLLWISGRAGTGKSTLMEAMVKRSKADTNEDSEALSASFFFHRRGDTLQQTKLGFFRSLLHQMLRVDDELLQDFTKNTNFTMRCRTEGEPGPGKNWDWTESDLRDQVPECVATFIKKCQLRLFVDALDEGGEASARDLMGFFHQLRSVSSTESQQISICVSCRPYPDVIRDWDYRIAVESENNLDIIAFLQINFRVSKEQARANYTSLDDVGKEIANRASGVFQRVVIVTRRVLALRGETKDYIFSEIAKTPRELGDLYENMLNQLKDSDKRMAARILQCITFAARPLSVHELRYAVAINPMHKITSDECLHHSSDWCADDAQFLERVTRLSQGLVTAVEPKYHSNNADADLVVQFDHESVQDYMTQRGVLFLWQADGVKFGSDGSGLAHQHLLMVCLRRLTAFNVYPAYQDRSRSQMPPLVEYAADYWGVHAQVCEVQGIMPLDLIKLSEWPSNKIWYPWQSIYRPDEPVGRTTLQHLASRYGLYSILTELLPLTKKWSFSSFKGVLARYPLWRGNVSHPRDDTGRTPLSWAAEAGHEAVIKLLLNNGAAVDCEDKYGRTPLFYAVLNRRHAALKILLDAGAPIDSEVENGQTLLWWAALSGDETMAKLLIDAGATVDRGPLFVAVERGHTDIVKLLLGAGKICIRAHSKYSTAPLLITALKRSGSDIVRLLLATGTADINACDETGVTPLMWASSHGLLVTVTQLLDDTELVVNAKDKMGDTALFCAVANGHVAIVKLLASRKDIDLNIVLDDCTALGYALRSDNVEIARVLLDHPRIDLHVFDKRWKSSSLWRPVWLWADYIYFDEIAELLLANEKLDVTQWDREGWTCASWAARSGNRYVINLLIARGEVSLNEYCHGMTPLQHAADRKDRGMLKILLATGMADDNFFEPNHGHILSLAVESGWQDVVKLLLDTGKIDVYAPMGKLFRPLSRAAELGHEGVVKVLLDVKDIWVDARDDCGRTALLLAVQQGHIAVVKLLLETDGVNVNVQDVESRRTALIWAAWGRHYKIVQMLLDTGHVDVSAEDSEGRTALDWLLTDEARHREGDVADDYAKARELLQRAV